jgi:hypothetical protein
MHKIGSQAIVILGLLIRAHVVIPALPFIKYHPKKIIVRIAMRMVVINVALRNAGISYTGNKPCRIDMTD